MNAKQMKVYSTMLKNYRKGACSDVFDLMYESSLGYGEVKSVLDGLVLDGDAEMLDIKTYGLTGDVEARAAVIFAGFNESERGDADAKEFADDPDGCVADDADDGVDELERLFEELVGTVDDDDDENDDEEECGDGNGEPYDDGAGERCAEEAREYYENSGLEFTSDLKLILEKTFALACFYNYSYIAAEHLLYSMLYTDGIACDLLKKAGADPEKYEEYFTRSLSADTSVTGFTPRAKYMLESAAGLARSISPASPRAGQEHLLLSILTLSDSIAVNILRMINVDVPALIGELERMVAAQGE
ncbi:MAG: hypothetical protein K2L72_04630 [Clostridia bacterium]|nr:hypothetical protein [Clostridia bacterium]